MNLPTPSLGHGRNPTGGPGVRLGGGAPSWLQQGPLQAEPPTAALPLPPCAHIPVLLVPGNPALLPTLTAVGGAGFSMVQIRRKITEVRKEHGYKMPTTRRLSLDPRERVQHLPGVGAASGLCPQFPQFTQDH